MIKSKIGDIFQNFNIHNSNCSMGKINYNQYNYRGLEWREMCLVALMFANLLSARVDIDKSLALLCFQRDAGNSPRAQWRSTLGRKHECVHACEYILCGAAFICRRYMDERLCHY